MHDFFFLFKLFFFYLRGSPISQSPSKQTNYNNYQGSKLVILDEEETKYYVKNIVHFRHKHTNSFSSKVLIVRNQLSPCDLIGRRMIYLSTENIASSHN